MTVNQLALPFQLETRVSARARRLRIEVRGPDEVRLTLPHRCSMAQAQQFLSQHLDWIERQRRRLQLRPAPTNTVAGPWDGRSPLPLHGQWLPVIYATHARNRPVFRHDGGVWRFHHHPNLILDPAIVTQFARKALLAEASSAARSVLRDTSLLMGLQPEGLRISDTRAQWGSCSAQGVIQLCWRLVCAPPEVLRYVVIHELSHLRHRNHSPRFWALVESFCPDYLTHRTWLRREGPELMKLLPLTRQ